MAKDFTYNLPSMITFVQRQTLCFAKELTHECESYGILSGRSFKSFCTWDVISQFIILRAIVKVLVLFLNIQNGAKFAVDTYLDLIKAIYILSHS